jgi:hypothetical protein
MEINKSGALGLYFSCMGAFFAVEAIKRCLNRQKTVRQRAADATPRSWEVPALAFVLACCGRKRRLI